MRTGAGSSHLPAPILAKATHWEEDAMANPNIAHPGILHASDCCYQTRWLGAFNFRLSNVI